MVDSVSADERSRIMKSVKSKGSKLENIVTKAIWNSGLRFRRNVTDLPGKPDVAIKKYKVVIFIDSCFWHGCSEHCRVPKSNINYWLSKIKRNKEKDLEISNFYKAHDWKILRIWEHQIKNNQEAVIKDIVSFLKSAKANP
jgi:DNA mismatch endonuclease, patch repair protein